MNSTIPNDWRQTATNGLVLALTGLHWIAYHGGHGLLTCADEIESLKQRLNGRSRGSRARRR